MVHKRILRCFCDCQWWEVWHIASDTNYEQDHSDWLIIFVYHYSSKEFRAVCRALLSHCIFIKPLWSSLDWKTVFNTFFFTVAVLLQYTQMKWKFPGITYWYLHTNDVEDIPVAIVLYLCQFFILYMGIISHKNNYRVGGKAAVAYI